MHRAPSILLGSRTRSYGTPIRRLLLSEDRGHNRSSEVFALMFSCWRALHERHWANLSAQHILLIPPLSQETGYLMFKPSSLPDVQYFKLFYNGDIPAYSHQLVETIASGFVRFALIQFFIETSETSPQLYKLRTVS